MRTREVDEIGALEVIAPDGPPCCPPAAPDGSTSMGWLVPVTDQPDLSDTFFRMIEVPGAVLATRLAGLWGAAPSVELGRFRLTGSPLERGDGFMVRGRWRRPMHRSSLPVEIELWPHLDRWTVVTIAPRRRVRLGRHYFRGGHRLLDQLAAALSAA